jgi:L-cysteate sulfo-lyase
VLVVLRARMNELVSTVDLGVWRTPVEHAPRLAERVGLRPDDLWVKRDDWLGFGGGGNKLRCRLTAASARRLDLGVVLVLEGDGPAGATGNLALDGRFQADVRWAGDIAGSALEDAVSAVAGELRAHRERPATLPFGGSNALAARGYFACAAELEEQAPEAKHVVVAVGSGATMAGLVAGLGAGRVLGFDSGAVPDAPARVAAMVDELASVGLSRPSPMISRCAWTTARLDLAMRQSPTRRAARSTMPGVPKGSSLNLCKTAKALAGLTAAVERDEIRPGERTVFVHTGGLPGLFGHSLAVELAARTRRAT